MRQRTLVYYTFESYWQQSANNPQFSLHRKATDGEACKHTYYTEESTCYCCCGDCSKDDDPE